MNDLAALLIPALGTALLHFLWQGALLGLLAVLALTLLRNAQPQARYAVACAALSVSLLMPALTLAWLLATPAGTAPATLPFAIADAASGTGASHGVQAMQPTTSLPWIVMLWASGVATLLLRMAGGLWWVRRLQRQAWPEDGGHWQARADVLARKLGLAHGVRVRLFDGDAPLAIGWWRPMVLLPVALLARMPAGLLEALLAHELAHIRRHDYLVNLLQAVVEALLFYHPVVWWLSRRIRHERELIADDLAAEALGDRRSLALALSELDRMLGATAAGSIPRFAHAAHGGQLMSRIQHLLRPRQHPLAIGLSLPLLGLALAGVAMYAHAQSSAPDTAPAGHVVAPPAPPAPPVPATAPVAALAAERATTPPPPPPAPPAPPADAAAPAAPPAPPPPPRRGAIHNVHAGIDSSTGYAVVRKGDTGFRMSGSTDDIASIRQLRHDIDGDFLWVRRGGNAYVVRDAGVLAGVTSAWRPVDALEGRMDALQARMQPHQQKLDALGARMEHMAPVETPEMRAAGKQLENLAEHQQALAEKQAQLARKMAKADDAGREALSRDMERLSEQMEVLSRQMERHSDVMSQQSAVMQRQSGKMESVAREMEAAARPMEAIGRDMEALGNQIEREAGIADTRIRSLIDEAIARGLAQPVKRR
ncbi:MAG TPA: M56 family metallopeptidase [Thermomonas sp.]|nr:M56 family metallopeptidase [Thermomonas sp.]